MQYHRKEWPLWLTEINASTHFQTYYVIGSIGHLGPKSVVWIQSSVKIIYDQIVHWVGGNKEKRGRGWPNLKTNLWQTESDESLLSSNV